MRKEHRVDELAPPMGHYTDAVSFGNLLFISGVAPVNERNELVGSDDVVAQTTQVFENMEKILHASLLTFADVLKITVYLQDVADAPLIGGVRKRFFKEARPASTLIGVGALAIAGMKVEIEAVAGLRSSEESGRQKGSP